MELVIASTNLHKIREFKEMFRGISSLDILSLRDFPEYVQCEETGKTLEENAILKAEHAAKALSRWVIADDSGLSVPALQGAPGVHSARYAGLKATDADNRKKLLTEMGSLQGEQRVAYFECCIALAGSHGLVKCVQGSCEGHISSHEKGGNGFGYDPLFIKTDYDKTFAELDEKTKNRISHRRKALDKILLVIEGLKL